MQIYDADLHIHSPYSIGVSNRMTIPNIAKGAQRKGVSIVGTGDATQPEWLKHLKATLQETDDGLKHGDTYFVITVEVEDNESIHHVIILPNFEAVDHFVVSLRPHSSNIDHKWGGRPRVNLNGETLAGIVRDVGGLIGPAHAFTPYRSIFREGKYDRLKDCYGTETDRIYFIELGLSADTRIADHIPELRDLTFITSSDAHSPSPNKLGREFIRLEIKTPTFEEIARALKRSGGRGVKLNVGVDPRLGKYYLSFCSSCRRTLIFKKGHSSSEFDSTNVYLYVDGPKEKANLLWRIHMREINCPACGKRMRLGVRDRAIMIGDAESRSPPHRPQYLHMPPLTELVRVACGVKSESSVKVRSIYDELIRNIGPETYILTEASEQAIAKINKAVADVIIAYRTNKVRYIPGGGGRYGRIIASWREKK